MTNELDRVLPLAEPLALSMGYEILKAELASDRGQRVLRIFLDKPEAGVGIEDCEKFSRALETILDVEAELPGRYHLEVSSPGLNRPLKLPRHFQAQVGKIIQVQTQQDFEGRHNFKGPLIRVQEVEDPWIEINVDQKNFQIPLNEIKKANLDYFATEEMQGRGMKGKKKL